MARFQSPVEAMKEIDQSKDKISEILTRDLAGMPNESFTIDMWLERFGHDRSLKSIKDELIRYEMAITDAEIYLNFKECPN